MTGVGLALPQIGPHVTADVVRRFAERSEELGYTSLWVQDHFLKPEQPATGYVGQPGVPIPAQYESVLQPLELLTAAAAWTSDCLLGSSVLVAGYYWPAQLAARLATIDVLSGGRLVVGLGAGWCVEEHEAVGVDPTTRGRRMDDFVPALVACWGEDPVSYEGPFFTIAPSAIKPKPLHRPTLLCGSHSPRGMARTARMFDGWNPAGFPLKVVLKRMAALNEARDAGLAPLECWHHVFTCTPGSPGPDTPVDDFVAEVVEASAAGVREMIIDASFSSEIAAPDDWLRVPEKFLPVLEAAQASV